CATASGPPTRRCRRPWCRRSPATCTTCPGSVASASCSPATEAREPAQLTVGRGRTRRIRHAPDGGCVDSPVRGLRTGSGGDADRRLLAGRLLALAASLLEDRAPRGVRVTAEQRS